MLCAGLPFLLPKKGKGSERQRLFVLLLFKDTAEHLSKRSRRSGRKHFNKMDPSKISLAFYSDEYSEAVRRYVIKELHFTGSPQEAVETCKRESDRYAILVLDEETVVGFFVLHGRAGAKKYTNNRKALLLRTFSIDSRFQGKGYGRRTIALLDVFVKEHFPNTDEVVLGVNHANVAAQKLYLHHGFADTGRRVTGIHGEQLVLSKRLGRK